MSEIGQRLREEREKIGLSQTELGNLGGVQKGAQVNYESGKRYPDASYLAAVAASGVDVLYVLTGRAVEGVVSQRPPLNGNLLAECIGAVDAALSERQADLPSEPKARLYLALYEFSLATGVVNEGAVGPLLGVALSAAGGAAR